MLASRKSYIEDFVKVYDTAVLRFGVDRVAQLWPEHVHALVSCGQVGKGDRGIYHRGMPRHFRGEPIHHTEMPTRWPVA